MGNINQVLYYPGEISNHLAPRESVEIFSRGGQMWPRPLGMLELSKDKRKEHSGGDMDL